MFRIAPMAVVLLVAALVACGDGGEEAEVTPTGTASPTVTVSPTSSVAPTLAKTPEVPADVACPSADVVKGDESSYLRTGWEMGNVICWTDASGEVSYRVEGTVVYWVPPVPQKCGETPRPRRTFSEPFRAEFAEELAANTTRFQLPMHADPAVGIKDFTIFIDALDVEGDVIVSGGTGVTKDAFCESG